MKTFTSLAAAREAGLKGPISYFVNRRQVGPAQFRQASGEVTVYRCGLEVYAEKNS